MSVDDVNRFVTFTKYYRKFIRKFVEGSKSEKFQFGPVFMKSKIVRNLGLEYIATLTIIIINVNAQIRVRDPPPSHCPLDLVDNTGYVILVRSIFSVSAFMTLEGVNASPCPWLFPFSRVWPKL